MNILFNAETQRRREMQKRMNESGALKEYTPIENSRSHDKWFCHCEEHSDEAIQVLLDDIDWIASASPRNGGWRKMS
jgi:hypothetical protein